MHGSNSASASNFDRITFCNGVYKTEYMSIQTKIQQYYGGWTLEGSLSSWLAQSVYWGQRSDSPSTAPDDPSGRN